MQDVWSYLRQGELLWLTATLVAYLGGDRLFRAGGARPLGSALGLGWALGSTGSR